jgi:hypothetical protein
MLITILDQKDKAELEQKLETKVGKAGWSANKYLGTDAEGNVAEKDPPESSDSSQNVELDTTLTQSGKAADAKAVGDAINKISVGNVDNDELLDLVIDCFDFGITEERPASSNLLNPDEILAGKYITPATGVSYDNANYSTTGYIPVNAGDIITFQADYDIGTPVRQCREWRFLAAFDENKQVVADAGSSVALRYYTVPNGISFVRFSWTSSAPFYNLAVNKIDAWNEEHPYTVVVPYEEYYDGEAGTVTGQTKLKPSAYAERSNGYVQETGNASWTSDWENHDMSNFFWTFRADIPNGLPNGITVGKGADQSYGAHIVVDATKVYYYIGTSSEPYAQYDHGLTLKDYIAIEYRIGFSLLVSLKLTTNGGAWTQTNINGDMRRGKFYVVNSGDAVNGRFSYYNKSWEAATQVYGDSYLTFANTRWLHYMRDLDGKNLFLNGYPGRASAKALTEVKKTMKHAKRPERIVWCLGMNDGDNGAVNSTWKSCVEELMEICEEQGIELILTTTPNVPTVDNTYKNEYVRNSGCRYIDFAAAVGADNGTVWYDGMLSSDGVHPDVQGGLALYTQAIADVPELIL